MNKRSNMRTFKLFVAFLIIPILSFPQSAEDFIEYQWLSHELEFQHLPDEYQFRSNNIDTLKFGMILNNIFDISKEEVSVLSINDGDLKVIKDANEIWEYDLLNHLKKPVSNNKGCSDLPQNVVLNLSYRTYDNKGFDKSISKINALLIVHLQYPSGTKNEASYVQATFCQPTIMLERHKKGILPQPSSKSILLAYDNRPKEENINEFYSKYNSAIKKMEDKEYEDLDYVETHLIKLMDSPDIASDYYFGNKVYKEGRYWDALLYFENVYNALQKSWWDGSIEEDEFNTMVECSYFIGECYFELKIFDKALKYLSFAKDYSSNVNYIMEYINCLIAIKDIRSLAIIDNYIKQYNNGAENKENLAFLNRRKAYCLIDMKKYTEAKKILIELLEDNPNDIKAKEELDYIKSTEKK